MIDLTVFYFDGTVENVAVQTLGSSYGGGCAASVDYLDCSDVDSRGVILSRTKVPSSSCDGPNTFFPESVLVPPERMRDAVLVKNGMDALLFRTGDGEMIPPGLSELFSFEEVREHVANAYVERFGIESLPDAVAEKLSRYDDEEEGEGEDGGGFEGLADLVGEDEEGGVAGGWDDDPDFG